MRGLPSARLREWKRGTPLAESPLVFEGGQTDVAVGGSAYLDRGSRYEMHVRSLTFYTSSHELAVAGGAIAPVPVPDDANVGTFADQLIVSLRSAWLGHAAGSLLAAPVAAFMDAADDAARQHGISSECPGPERSAAAARMPRTGYGGTLLPTQGRCHCLGPSRRAARCSPCSSHPRRAARC